VSGSDQSRGRPGAVVAFPTRRIRP
jgi:hypothetical protein